MSWAQEAAMLAVLAALTLASLWRELPTQYMLTVIAIMYGISALAWLVLKDAYWWLPLIVLNSRGVSRLVLFKWRDRPCYGWWLMALTCALTTILLPRWTSPLLALAMQIAALPWLIKRRPGADAPRYFAVANWILLAAWILVRKF